MLFVADETSHKLEDRSEKKLSLWMPGPHLETAMVVPGA